MADWLVPALQGIVLGLVFAIGVITGTFLYRALKFWWHRRADRRRLRAIDQLRAQMADEDRRAHLNVVSRFGER